MARRGFAYGAAHLVASAIVAFVALGAGPAAAQTVQSYSYDKIPAEGLPFTITCEPPPNVVDKDGKRQPIDLSRLVYAFAADGGAVTADSPTCVFGFTVFKDGDHPLAVIARYKQEDGRLISSDPGQAVLNVVIRVTLTPLPPLCCTATPVAPGAAATNAPFTFNGHTWALTNGVIQRDGQAAADAGIGCTRLVLTPTQMVAAFCPDGNWWMWSDTATPRWTNVGKQTPKE